MEKLLAKRRKLARFGLQLPPDERLLLERLLYRLGWTRAEYMKPRRVIRYAVLGGRFEEHNNLIKAIKDADAEDVETQRITNPINPHSGAKGDGTSRLAFADWLEENQVPGAHIVRQHAHGILNGTRTKNPRVHDHKGWIAYPEKYDQTPIYAFGPDGRLEAKTDDQRQELGTGPGGLGTWLQLYHVSPDRKRRGVVIAVNHAPDASDRYKGVTHSALARTPEEMRQLLSDFPRDQVADLIHVHRHWLRRKPIEPPTEPTPMSRRVVKYAKIDGHEPAHPLVAGMPIEFALRSIANDPKLPSHVRDTAWIALTGKNKLTGETNPNGMPDALWALNDQLQEIDHPLASHREGGYNWMSAADKVVLDRHTHTALTELADEMRRVHNIRPAEDNWTITPEGQAMRVAQALGKQKHHAREVAARNTEMLNRVRGRVSALSGVTDQKMIDESVRRHAHRALYTWRVKNGVRQVPGENKMVHDAYHERSIQPIKKRDEAAEAKADDGVYQSIMNEKATRYARLSLSPGKPFVGPAGEKMSEHSYTDESGKELGVIRVHPRNDGKTLHVHWIGPRSGTASGEAIGSIGAEGLKSIKEGLKTHYPQTEFLTGIRTGGFRTKKPERTVIPMYRRVVVKYAGKKKPKGLYHKLVSLRPHMAKAAQEVYDQWDADSDPEYGDPDLGFGGICQDIACAIGGVLANHGINTKELDAQTGDQHVWVMAHDGKEAYHVDIHPHHYEAGAGYSWKKIPGVQFTPDHISIDKEDRPDDILGAEDYSRKKRYKKQLTGTFIDALRRAVASNSDALKQAGEKIARRIGAWPTKTFSALHDTPQGATPGVAQVVYGRTSPEQVHALASWVGLVGNLPGVAVFHNRPTGPDYLHRVRAEGSGIDLRAKLDRFGIRYRVLIPHGKGFDILIPDRGGRSYDAVQQYADQNRQHVQSSRGHFNEIGSTDQSQARTSFRNRIAKAEAKMSRAKKYSQQYTHADFVKKILEEPHERMHPLAYADWLEENGHTAVAEVLRRHVEKGARDDPGQRTYVLTAFLPAEWTGYHVSDGGRMSGQPHAFTPGTWSDGGTQVAGVNVLFPTLPSWYTGGSENRMFRSQPVHAGVVVPVHEAHRLFSKMVDEGVVNADRAVRDLEKHHDELKGRKYNRGTHRSRVVKLAKARNARRREGVKPRLYMTDRQDLLNELQKPEYAHHMAGLDDPLQGLRGVAADHLDEQGRADEAELLRKPDTHVVIHKGRVLPNFMERQQVRGRDNYEQFVKPTYDGWINDYEPYHGFTYWFATYGTPRRISRSGGLEDVPGEEPRWWWNPADGDGLSEEEVGDIHPKHNEYQGTEEHPDYLTPAEIAWMKHHAKTPQFKRG